MSGGVLLPGNATTADVNNGKTFSSKSGFNITGTAQLAVPGSLVQRPAANSGQGINSITFTFDQNPTNNVIVTFASQNGISATSVSGLGGTWNQAAQNYSSGSGLQSDIWICSNPNGSSNTVTCNTPSGSAVFMHGCAYEMIGPLSVNSTNTGSGGSVNVTSPAGGFCAMIGVTSSISDLSNVSAIYGNLSHYYVGSSNGCGPCAFQVNCPSGTITLGTSSGSWLMVIASFNV